MNVPPEISIFLVTVAAMFVIGLPLITRRISLPSVVDFDVVHDNELSDRQSVFFAELDGRLADLGFRPGVNFRPTNLQGDALVRAYLSEVDPAVVSINLLRSSPAHGEDLSTNFLELTTAFADETMLNTRNAQVSDVFKPIPGQIIQECPTLLDPAALKKIHDRRTEELRIKGPQFRRAEELLARYQEFHERWCRHQIETGYLKPVNEEGRHHVTIRTGLRGIANFLNPFADNFTIRRFLLAVAFGVLLPACSIAWLGDPDNPLTPRVAEALGVRFDTAMALCLAPVFTIVGAMAGYLFSGKSFIWTFVLAYLPLRLLGPAGYIPLWLSLWTGLVAALVTRWHEERTALL